MPTLLERTHELATLESAARAVKSGEGAMIAVTGRAGLGKTRLLEAALATAQAHGLRCAQARGGELERDLGWGIAVDAVEALLGDVGPGERATLLSGRARHAAMVLADEPAQAQRAVGGSAAQQAAIVAALTLVVRRVAADQPLAIVIDDLHWVDGPSLRWLCHLAGRIERMSVLLVVGFRANEPGASDMLASLDEAATTTLRPASLTPAATARLVDASLDSSADSSTRAAVHEVTAGNPFLIDQLLRHLAAGPVTAEAVWNARPERLAALVIPRLARLGEDAKALSEAVAVLGVDSSLRHAAELAGLDRAQAVHAAERLSATGIFDDRLPLTYAHPLLREVVKTGLSAARLDDLRRRAARMLAASEADPTAGAVHLLAAEPVGEAWAGRILNAAGHHEMRRAAYDSAAAFFERALREPPDEATPRHSVTLYLGRALLLAGRDQGLAALRQALEETPDHVERATVALEVGSALMGVDQPQRAVEVYESGLSASDELGEALRIDLLAQRALAGLAFREQPERTIGAVAAAMEATTAAPEAASRAALGLSALVAVWTGETAAHCTGLLHRALAAQPYGDADSPEWTPDLAWVNAGLAWCDAHEQREPFLDAVIERARERGAMLNVAGAALSRSLGRMRQGRVADAEADARLARQIYLDLDHAHHAMVSAFELDPLIARSALAEADRLLAAAPPHRDDDQVVYLALLDARARLRMVQGRLEEARQDLELLRAEVEQQGFQCPAALAWRPQLAVVLHALGEPAAGRALAAEDLERTRAFGAPRAYGLALLATAATSPPQAAQAALVEATEILAASPARLEHARALVELGALTRRLGQRSEALDLLRTGLDRAASCGAAALVARARDELRIAGARPRRERVSGPASLTAAERRVGELAARGVTNADIARMLVVSLRTVETHLTSIYRKLDIKRREELAQALEPDPRSPSQAGAKGQVVT